MKLLSQTLSSVCLLFIAIAPSSALPSQIPDSHFSQPSQLAMKTQSDQLFVKVKITPQGLHKQYLILTTKGIAVRTKAGNLLTLKKNLQPINLGQYVRQGKHLAIQWANGDRWRMTAHPNGWQLGTQKSNLYTTALPVAAQTLRGRYIAESSRSAGVIGGPTPRVNAYTQTTFIFSGDGRFRSTGFAGVSGSTYRNTGRPTGRGVSTSDQNRAGRYQIGQYQLFLRDTQGRQTQHTLFRLPTWGNAVMIDGRIFQHR